MNKFKLGNRVRCIVSGFEGIITAKIEYLNGCCQFCVQPRCDDKEGTGKKPDALYFDWQQLELVDAGISIEGLGTGGPASNAPTQYGI